MVKHVTRTFRQAVRGATASVKQIAAEAGYSRVTFDKYLNERPATVAACLALADALEKRSQRLHSYSVKLREAAGERDRDAAPPARRAQPRKRKGSR
jgi:hypothetical protein